MTGRSSSRLNASHISNSVSIANVRSFDSVPFFYLCDGISVKVKWIKYQRITLIEISQTEKERDRQTYPDERSHKGPKLVGPYTGYYWYYVGSILMSHESFDIFT